MGIHGPQTAAKPAKRLRALPGLALAYAALLAQAEPLPEYAVKAAFLYNFFKFVEWPVKDEGQPWDLCLLGQDPFGEALAPIEGKKAQGHPLRVQRNIDLEQAKTACQILFINEPEQSLGKLFRLLEGVPVLTVGDGDGFVAAGGMVGLVMADQRVQMEINLKAVEKANIKISSQLLKLAHIR